ncbi:hypothetical protein EYR36_010081 [Pleurotus pulmonarius]|nr:hypothetical protein EYR36_010081 [Pleurotus pulmonarius]
MGFKLTPRCRSISNTSIIIAADFAATSQGSLPSIAARVVFQGKLALVPNQRPQCGLASLVSAQFHKSQTANVNEEVRISDKLHTLTTIVSQMPPPRSAHTEARKRAESRQGRPHKPGSDETNLRDDVSHDGVCRESELKLDRHSMDLELPQRSHANHNGTDFNQ